MTFPACFGVSAGTFRYNKMSALKKKKKREKKGNMHSSSGPVINKCHLVAVYCVGVELSLCGHVGYKEILRMLLCVIVGRLV